MAISEDDAKKEHDSIQEEIAKEHGDDTKLDDDNLDDEGDELDDKKKKSEDDLDSDDDEDEDAEDDDSDEGAKSRKPPTREGRAVPVAKYQELKRTSREKLNAANDALSEKDRKIAELNEKLAATQTTDEMKKKVKDYAEKHGKTEEEVIELLQLLPKATLDPETKAAERRVQLQAKKAEAEEAYQNELQELLRETPEAKDQAEAIRKAAFKDKNLTKSLYEIFHREIKPGLTSKKTAETSRPSRRDNAGEPDYKKIMEDLNKNVPGAMDGLTEKQLDTLFDLMDKTGSRYTRNR